MKLERISENQIRCTLTRSDLADRELKISELAYGTEKAKALFREMMMQASDELGFEADNIPLIIEAIPISNECIMLIVTKVEDPEELDTRFSKFTPFPDEQDATDDEDDVIYTGTEEILDIFKRLSNDILAKAVDTNILHKNETNDSVSIPDAGDDAGTEESQFLFRIYEFRTLEDVSRLSTLLPEDHDCGNTLYKNPKNQHFYLVLSNKGIAASTFNGVCHLASEFGSCQKASANTLYYYDEHYETIIRENALQILRSL
ncbi:MAG: adaptor protein MecA [Coprococcus sp.]